MKKISTRRIALLAANATLGAALAIPLAAPPEAGAITMSYTLRTDIHWGGTLCIEVESATMGDEYRSTSVDTICSPAGSRDFIQSRVKVGMVFGANPIMGNASWISCQVYRGDVQILADYAQAGDGTDVNCLRRAT